MFFENKQKEIFPTYEFMVPQSQMDYFNLLRYAHLFLNVCALKQASHTL